MVRLSGSMATVTPSNRSSVIAANASGVSPVRRARVPHPVSVSLWNDERGPSWTARETG